MKKVAEKTEKQLVQDLRRQALGAVSELLRTRNAAAAMEAARVYTTLKSQR